jgi:hypothetical protein
VSWALLIDETSMSFITFGLSELATLFIENSNSRSVIKYLNMTCTFWVGLKVDIFIMNTNKITP